MVTIAPGPLSLQDVWAVAVNFEQAVVSPEARARASASRKVVDQIVESGSVVYGINTGFGRLSDVTIPNAELAELQLNLVRSHAVGVGEPLSEPEVRAMMLLRANVLAQGNSGARPELIDLLVELLNARIYPYVPSQGSVGASGDLAPLAHLALVLIGEGNVLLDGQRVATIDVFEKKSIQPVVLGPKEGLALLNGTQAIGAVGILSLLRAMACMEAANCAGAMTLEALMGTPTAYDSRIHEARRHAGQIAVAQTMLKLLECSEIRESHRENDPRVQDAYCLRCLPQVHGACLAALDFACGILEQETGAATDNPLVFADQGDVISGGNFHAAPLAGVLDFAAIALTDLLSICERRTDRLVNPDTNEGLPPFLSRHAGTGSGFMMAHVTTAALLNDCKVLSHPASVDSVPTSGAKEDHVSMGMTSALKLRKIVENVERGLAIELLAAAEGLEHRKPLKPGVGVQKAYEVVRKHAPELAVDRSLSDDIERLATAIRNKEFQF